MTVGILPNGLNNLLMAGKKNDLAFFSKFAQRPNGPFAAFVVEVNEYIICKHRHGVPDTFYALQQRNTQGEIELLACARRKETRLSFAPGHIHSHDAPVVFHSYFNPCPTRHQGEQTGRTGVHLGHAFAFPLFDSASQGAASKKKLRKVFRFFVLSCDDLSTLRFQKIELAKALRIEEALFQFAEANVVSAHRLKENVSLLERLLERLANAFETLALIALNTVEESVSARLLSIEDLMLRGFSSFKNLYPLFDAAQFREPGARPFHGGTGVSN